MNQTSNIAAILIILVILLRARKIWSSRLFSLARSCKLALSFFRNGPPETAETVLAQEPKPECAVCTEKLLGYGSLSFVSSAAVAEKLFTAGNTFSNRLGATAGLRCLGMNGQGIIWNNNIERWEHCRKYFAKAVQEGATQPKNLPNTAAVCVASFATTQKQLLGATSSGILGTDSNMHFTYNPMRQESKTLLSLDPLQFLRCCTFRIITALNFGLSVDTFSLKETQGFVANVHGYFEAWEYFLMRSRHLTLKTKARRHKDAIKKLNDDVTTIMEKAKAELDKQPKDCFLSWLLRDQQAGLLSGPEVQQLVLEMIIAGTDTSSMTMFYLLKACQDDPILEQDLRAEVDHVVGGREIHHGDLEHFEKIPAALQEAMRFKPVGPVAIRQATTDFHIPPGFMKGCPLGLTFKPGDSVVVDLAGMHRDPEVFAHPHLFDISHFLGRNASLANSSVFRPFGHGRKGCVGKHLAMFEMKVLMACWFQTFAISQQQGNIARQTLADMVTHWFVANMPTSVTLFQVHYRSCSLSRSSPRQTHTALQRIPRVTRICVIGAHGVGKTTLVTALNEMYPGHFQVITEVARQVLRATGMTREHLQRDEAQFLDFQKLVLLSQMAAEMRVGRSCILSDRTIFDPLAYTSWRFGLESKQAQSLLRLPNVSDAIQQWSSANCLVLLVEPWSQPGVAAQDDGVRLLTDVHGLHAAYKQVLDMLNVAHTTVPCGSLQARVSQILAVLDERH